MTRQENIDIIRKACVAANPEIMELKFGCRFAVSKRSEFEELGVASGDYVALFDFEFDSEYFHKAINVNAALKIHFLEGKTTDYEVTKVVTFGAFKKLLANRNIEIIGRPIRLADVLLAIHALEPDNRPPYFNVGCDGGFYSVDYTYPDDQTCKVVHTGLGGFGAGWLLEKDDLTEQTNECLEFLAHLLTNQ